jgi:hypothetical protein
MLAKLSRLLRRALFSSPQAWRVEIIRKPRRSPACSFACHRHAQSADTDLRRIGSAKEELEVVPFAKPSSSCLSLNTAVRGAEFPAPSSAHPAFPSIARHRIRSDIRRCRLKLHRTRRRLCRWRPWATLSPQLPPSARSADTRHSDPAPARPWAILMAATTPPNRVIFFTSVSTRADTPRDKSCPQ